MNDSAGEITNPKFRMWLRTDGIVQLVWEPGVAMGLDDAIAATDAMTTLTGGQRRPLMVDTQAAGPMDRLARMEFAGRGDLVTAVGLLIATPLSRMSGNFFLGVTKPKTPTRLFDCEAGALAWLSQHVP